MKLKVSRALFWAVVWALIVAAGGGLCWPAPNDYQSEGTIVLSGLSKPVTVMRDEKGMPYIYAQNLDDAIMALGFVTGQDRLFQMQLMRLTAEGRYAEYDGDPAWVSQDEYMRTIGIHRNAKRHTDILDDDTRLLIQKYLDGVNAFITTRPKEHHIEFERAGIKPETWEISDSLAISYYLAWFASGNMNTQIIAQMLVDKLGLQRANQLFPLNINPDDPSDEVTKLKTSADTGEPLHFAEDHSLLKYLGTLGRGFGSNNWAVSPMLSSSGKPILANDPHLNKAPLPGAYYPAGIITPQLRAVGAMIPGTCRMAICRTDRYAMGITNNYGDCQDLYVETVDPDDHSKYKEGTESVPFKVVWETRRIRDSHAAAGYREEPLEIKFTRRGPVVSGPRPDGKVITMRWAAAETMGPSMGLKELLTARSVKDVREAIRQWNYFVLNCVFADVDGNIGYHVSGKLPIRSQGGTVPYVVTDSSDNWIGWIPFEQMPNSENPSRGWLGTCNHTIVDTNYPYYYSSRFAPSYRYRRLKQLMNDSTPKPANEHWEFQRDPKNLMAQQIAPIIVKALIVQADTKEIGELLAKWDYRDDPNQVAPTLFQSIYRNFVRLAFEDLLGPDLTLRMLRDDSFWAERLQSMLLAGSLPATDDLFHKAALEAQRQLSDKFGQDRKAWTWGKVHQIEFVPGGGRHPMGGSGETLYCAHYDCDKIFDVNFSAALRMVADLGDDDKVIAVLPGGVCERTDHPHQKDQVEKYMSGKQVYWWFSDKTIKEHAKATLTLKPR